MHGSTFFQKKKMRAPSAAPSSHASWEAFGWRLQVFPCSSEQTKLHGPALVVFVVTATSCHDASVSKHTLKNTQKTEFERKPQGERGKSWPIMKHGTCGREHEKKKEEEERKEEIDEWTRLCEEALVNEAKRSLCPGHTEQRRRTS